MPSVPAYATVGDLSPTRRLGLFTWVALLCLLGWDFSGLDPAVMHAVAKDGVFVLRDNWWLEMVLHTRAKQLAIVVYFGLLVMVWWPKGVFRQWTRLQRVEIMVGITLSLITISTLKRYSLTSCPWELQGLGGIAAYVSHWHGGIPDGGSGNCFPGGHVSSAFAFLALALPWLGSDQAQQRTMGRRILTSVVFIGLVLGLTQTLRGAHYPSHTLWTGFICWTVAFANHLLFGWWAYRRTHR